MRIVDNMLSEELIVDLKMYSRTHKECRSNLTSWETKVIGESGLILVFDLPPELNNRVKSEIMSKYIINRAFDKYHWGSTIHLGSRMSCIPWHNDKQSISNITCYLNTTWEPDWGGYFVYEDGSELKAVLPKYNRGLIYSPPLMHSVALASFNSPLRESLQIFISKSVQ